MKLTEQTQSLPHQTPVAGFYLIQGIASVAANFMLVGIFYYTASRLGWGMSANLMLAAGQGVCYTCGALAASKLSRRIGPRRLLTTVLLLTSLLALTPLLLRGQTPLIAVLLLYSGVSAAQWPLLESFISAGADGEQLSRRLTLYNLGWSSTGAATVAASGAVIQMWPAGVFILPMILTATAALISILLPPSPPITPHPATHLELEPQLLAVRTSALWLSRIALPASYVVVYSLSAMMPTLAVMKPLATQWRTLVGSIWFIARFLAFIALGATAFWHTRPRLILAAGLVMLIAFLGTALRPSDWLGGIDSARLDLLSMICWQILLGAAMGLIYAASLYFGMVLSQGSTDHGGYHEALIGLGSAIGPAAAAAAHHLQPNGISLSVAAVATLIAASLGAAVIVSRTGRENAG